MKLIEETKALAPWTATLPSDWLETRLDAVADVLFSNVDKHTIEGETIVKLCNYVDVYKNNTITRALDFMEASAEPREIERFQIQHGDVLATKDSDVKGGVKLDHWGGEKVDHFTGRRGFGLKDLRGRRERRPATRFAGRV